MTRKGLEQLAQFRPVFERPDFIAGVWAGGDEVTPGVVHMPFVSYSDEVTSFVEAAYKRRWIMKDFNWGEWASTDEATELRDNAASLEMASPDQLAKLLTTLIRQDRFVEGALINAFESGLMLGIVRRATAILEASPGPPLKV